MTFKQTFTNWIELFSHCQIVPVTCFKHQFGITNTDVFKNEVLVSEKNLKVYLKLIFAPHPFWAKWENQRSEKLNIGCTPHGINFARSKYYTFLDFRTCLTPLFVYPIKKGYKLMGIFPFFYYSLDRFLSRFSSLGPNDLVQWVCKWWKW